MKTVTEISRLTGVSVRTLHHYDAIGLLPPTCVTDAGYRLYDDVALERLYQILILREIDFSLKEIQEILDTPDSTSALDMQIQNLEQKVQHLQNRLTLARGMKTIGVNHMDFKELNINEIDDYSAQAKALYGKTEAYQEYAQKSKNRSKNQEQALADGLMELFVQLGTMRDQYPGSAAVQQWVAQLQAYITEHYYTCTPQILRCLGEGYAASGAMNDNIDKSAGHGTGAFAKAAIDIYCK